MKLTTVNVESLLARGDQLSIEHGVLKIKPASRKPVPSFWLEEHGSRLTIEILNQLRLQAYEYHFYSTGCYGKNKHAGISMQFFSLVSGEGAHTLFNVSLVRQRTTKAGRQGERLPKGHFTVRRGSAFAKFWLRAGLPLPQRLSKIHECMGKLRGILFSAPQVGGRLDKNKLAPLEVSATTISRAFLTASEHPMDSLGSAKLPSRRAPKGLQPAQLSQGVQRTSTACLEYHDNKVISMRAYTVKQTVVNKPPSEQTDEEWWNDYDEANPQPDCGTRGGQGENL